MSGPKWDDTKEVPPSWDDTNPADDSKSKGSDRPFYSVDPSNLGRGALEAMKLYDDYTGAPIRKKTTEILTGEKMEKAPTGADQAKLMGATDVTYGEYLKDNVGVELPAYLGRDVSPADIYGVGLEIVQDPFVLASMAKNGVKSLGKILKNVSPDDALKHTRSTQVAQKQLVDGSSEAGARAQAQVQGGGLNVEQSGNLFEVKAPQSLKELRAWKAPEKAGHLPARARLEQIEKIVPDLNVKPLKYHYDMLDNPKSMRELKNKFEGLPTDEAKKLASYHQSMYDDAVTKINDFADGISGANPRDINDAGLDFIATAKNKYVDEKKTLGPMFKKMNARAQKMNLSASHDLIVAIEQNTKLKGLIAKDDAGRFFLQKNKPRTGLGSDEYNKLAEIIDDLNDGMTFKEVQNARAYLKKSMDPMNPGATGELNKVRSIMLDQLEGMAGKLGDDVRPAFTSYAKNERARESIEKIIGGRLETLDKMYASNPDKVLKKIFSNPNYTETVRDFVGQDKLNEMVASYVKAGINHATDGAKGFSPSKFKSWLKNNNAFVEANLSPEAVQRIKALADYSDLTRQYLAPVNPSGTAEALISSIKPAKFMQKVEHGGWSAGLRSETIGRVSNKLEQNSSLNSLDELLGNSKPKRRMSLPSPKYIDDAAAASQGGAMTRGLVKEPKSSMRSAEDKEPFERKEGTIVADKKKLKGREKWAKDGYDKLLKHSKENKQLKKNKGVLLNDPKIKKMLIPASGLKPGSKAMEKIMAKIMKQLKGAS